ncbi:MAG: hypothetical protein HZA93_28140 [Verrucomicrobia bacterium]|nr:hypothetical protein [Verrucomicrobiota bacterium]
MGCPFEAECIRERPASPLKRGERVTVAGLLDDDEAADALGEMEVKSRGRAGHWGRPWHSSYQWRLIFGRQPQVGLCARPSSYRVAQGRRFCFRRFKAAGKNFNFDRAS